MHGLRLKPLRRWGDLCSVQVGHELRQLDSITEKKTKQTSTKRVKPSSALPRVVFAFAKEQRTPEIPYIDGCETELVFARFRSHESVI